MTEKLNRQQAPFPEELAEIVKNLRYRPKWLFALDDIERDPASTHGAMAGGLTFVVTTIGYNSYHPELGQTYRVNHYFPVPAATYNYQSWIRWVFDCLVKVETHEVMEFFYIEHPENSPFASYRPFAPNHGPGWDPYIIRELSTDEDRRTSFRGVVHDG